MMNGLIQWQEFLMASKQVRLNSIKSIRLHKVLTITIRTRHKRIIRDLQIIMPKCHLNIRISNFLLNLLLKLSIQAWSDNHILCSNLDLQCTWTILDNQCITPICPLSIRCSNSLPNKLEVLKWHKTLSHLRSRWCRVIKILNLF